MSLAISASVACRLTWVVWQHLLASTARGRDNSLVPHILVKYGGFADLAQRLAQAVLAQYFWTALSMFMLSFTLELTRLVYTAFYLGQKTCSSSQRDVLVTAGLCILPFFLTGPTLGMAVFTAPWGDTSIVTKAPNFLDSPTLRVTQAATLAGVFIACVLAVGKQ